MSLRDIKRRIRSVKLTKKITKAIQMVAAAKVKQAQAKALATRAYREQLLTMIQNTGMANLKLPATASTLYVYFSSDRGLCGSYNSQLQKFFLKTALETKKQNRVITIGRKGFQALRSLGFHITASFVGFSDKPRLVDILPVVHMITESLMTKKISKVVLVYQSFINAAVQKPSFRTLLPADESHQSQDEDIEADYFEPNRQTISKALLPHYLQVMIYQTLLEANASEQYARMMAMDQASSNATDLIADLTQTYNKLRQSAITTELAEIVSGRGKH